MYFSYFGISEWALMCRCFSIHLAGYFTGKAAQNSQGYGFRVKMALSLVNFGAHEHLEHDGVHTPAWVHEDFMPFERLLAPIARGGAGAELGQQQADIFVLNALCFKLSLFQT